MRRDRTLALTTPAKLVDQLSLVEALPAFVSVAARKSRSGAAVEHWFGLAAQVGRPLSEIVEDLGFLLRLAPDLFAFYLLLWELVRKAES